MKLLNKKAKKFSKDNFIWNLAITIVASITIWIISESWVAALTIFIAAVINCFRFVYMDYLAEREIPSKNKERQ